MPLGWFVLGFVCGWVSMGFIAMRIAMKDELRRAREGR